MVVELRRHWTVLSHHGMGGAHQKTGIAQRCHVATNVPFSVVDSWINPRVPSPAVAQWGPLRVTVHGLEVALSLGLRTAVLVVVGLLCGLLIDKHQLVAAIDLSPVPPQVGYLLAATLFLLPQMTEKQRQIGEAQTLRNAGIGTGLTGWFQRVRLRAVPLVLTSMQDAQDRAVHLSARGFPATGVRTRLREVPDTSVQRGIRWAAVICAVLGPVMILAPTWFGIN
ncbi:energy-coupling factor transporter transmembrane protein EcfT [Glutamicibacter sp. M10]|uniref:energy-coupling factor transporter transmembrane component T family protein n=1 Tax=Glutamicibacter sp. M10 TaxID=3023076 RepID=UPI0021C6783A|nr:energy-coupling factor transporter transmembrane component T [Glutamicibacter sp. M10]UXN32721.1 energy-coupling factor transporter transmembrane protein EcfT [Glutamicibacter sp. M10]